MTAIRKPTASAAGHWHELLGYACRMTISSAKALSSPANRDASGRVLRHFGAGVVDQVLLSGANFIAGFLMIRYTGDVNYGHFVIAQSTLLLIAAAQGAWVLAPLAVIAPTKAPPIRREMVGSIWSSQSKALVRLFVIGLPIPLGGYLLRLWDLSSALTATGVVVAGWAALNREFLRNALLIYSRPRDMLRADIAYVAVLVVGIACTAFSTLPDRGVVAVGVLAIAAGAGAAACHRLFSRDPGWVRADPQPYWIELRRIGLWSTVGAMVYWVITQGYNYILASRLNLTAVADVNAARLVVMPVVVFTLGINNLLLPAAANWLVELGLRRLLQRLALLTVAVTVVDFGYFVPAWWCRRWLLHDVLHKSIVDQDRLLVLWGLIALIMLFREVLQATLYALKRIKSMTSLNCVAAVVALTMTFAGVSRWGAAGALIGQIAGECVNLVGLLLLLSWQVRMASK